LARVLGIIGAAALLAAAAQAAVAPPPTGYDVPISALVGLDPPAVRSRLSAVPPKWPTPPAFQIYTSRGLLTFIDLQSLMTDPALARELAALRTHGDGIPPEPEVLCSEYLVRGTGQAELDSTTLLLFRDGRLEAAFKPTLFQPRIQAQADPTAYMRQPRNDFYIARPGELPLEDGLGFFSRWRKTTLSPTDRLSASCEPAHPYIPPAHLPRHTPPWYAQRRAIPWYADPGNIQGLAGLPFAWTLPFKNRQRVMARQQGAALLASLHVGAMLGAPPRKFAADHPGVRVYRAERGDYAVLSIDLGGYPGRNLSKNNDAALMGVRSGRIEWISASPVGFGPHGGELCVGADGIAGAPRRGCSGYGNFSPTD
jgi:hypothetical protein